MRRLRAWAGRTDVADFLDAMRCGIAGWPAYLMVVAVSAALGVR